MFPLDLQLEVMKGVIAPKYWSSIDLFEDISRSTWDSPIGELQWTKGQPLGLYPSFAAFTLTHGTLLSYLSKGKNGLFYVVGDDVVILDDDLYRSYISVLDWMECPWSKDKTISSNKLSEFAGKIVTSEWVIPQMKWRRFSDENFLDLCRDLGHRSRVLLSDRQKRVFDRVAHLCSPIGLNFSYKGSTLEKMVMDTLDFYQPEKEVLGSLMGLRRRLHRHVYEVPTQLLNNREIEEICATFDEKVVSVLTETVFKRGFTSYEGLATVPRAIGLTTLPVERMLPSRVTTLQRYERYLEHKP
jgi:hypothetical protein